MRNLFPQQDSESLTQSVNCNINGADTNPTLAGQFRAGESTLASGEESSEILEEIALFTR